MLYLYNCHRTKNDIEQTVVITLKGYNKVYSAITEVRNILGLVYGNVPTWTIANSLAAEDGKQIEYDGIVKGSLVCKCSAGLVNVKVNGDLNNPTSFKEAVDTAVKKVVGNTVTDIVIITALFSEGV